MGSSTVQNNLYWQLFRVGHSIKQVMMTVAERYHLTVMQMYILCLMEKDVSIPMNSLANMLHCDASNITFTIDKLFQKELVSREECQKDRRIKMLSLTTAGKEMYEKIAQDLLTYQPESLAGLTEQQKQQLLSLLRLTEFKRISCDKQK
jgi:DNA-binding MarR family transcriptional regulator